MFVPSITTADAHTSADSRRRKWRPHRFKWTRSVSPKDEIWVLRVCHHISNAVYHTTANDCFGGGGSGGVFSRLSPPEKDSPWPNAGTRFCEVSSNSYIQRVLRLISWGANMKDPNLITNYHLVTMSRAVSLHPPPKCLYVVDRANRTYATVPLNLLASEFYI
jgi:hypothetical protein